MNERRLLFVDTETTGLDPLRHEVIECAWRLTTPDGVMIVEEGNTLVAMENPSTAEPGALRINGYKEEEWKGAMSQKDFARRFWKISKDAVLVGHNVSFDEGMLHSSLIRAGCKPSLIPWHYQTACTMRMAWPAYQCGKLKSLRLADVGPFYGCGEQKTPHRAMDDMLLCWRIYMAQMSMYGTIMPPLPGVADSASHQETATLPPGFDIVQ